MQMIRSLDGTICTTFKMVRYADDTISRWYDMYDIQNVRYADDTISRWYDMYDIQNGKICR